MNLERLLFLKISYIVLHSDKKTPKTNTVTLIMTGTLYTTVSDSNKENNYNIIFTFMITDRLVKNLQDLTYAKISSIC